MFYKKIIMNILPIIWFCLLYPKFTKCSLQGEEVRSWADTLGTELWNFGRAITKYTEIKETYRHLNAQVEKKDPEELLDEIKENILRMMDRKMDAIRCIQQTAENVSEIFEFNLTKPYKYYSSKYSPAEDAPPVKLPETLKKLKYMYKTLKLNNDTHFYNLAVNTTHSSVHVPTNVFDLEKEAKFAIQWSEALDKVFVQNYNSDPALSWQYFGSTAGIMRHYPAKKWEDIKKDLFDCRIRTWFIEAATCTKDVVILIDNSGSMEGMGKHIAALTAYSILETFSNNDYVNVMNYSANTNWTVPCFEDILVQATKENIELFKASIRELKPEGKTNVEQALERAFDLLSTYREKRKCNEGENTNCNQAIMIITDGIKGNLSEAIMRNNYLNNGTNIPVRIFTYLIGKEVTHEAEIKWVSCANRGYYTHVQSLEQVTASVFEYVKVVARPLVLQDVEHPVSWTHSYIDLTYDDKNDNTINEPYRLLTSAAIPCFDRRTNKLNDSRTADLLGVAATDVPIDDFRKLTLPYKIGVNAYSFIVSNNGYVLMHPDLRPMFEGEIKINYNSVDLTEVEQIDDGKNAREISEIMHELRSALVNGLEGSKHNVELKYHYNNMKRASKQSYDYYYTPLEGTPFSVAIAIPNTYGKYSLNVTDIIKKHQHTGLNLTDFFKGKWRIHPKWVYCRYHYLEGHEYKTPEEELIHFLNRMYDRDFEWKRQYEADKKDANATSKIEKEDLSEVKCGRKNLGQEDYYCDRKLVERLIFDAKTTTNVFSTEARWNRSKEDGELTLFKRYNVTLRFVATMSGLTRWDYVYDDIKDDEKTNNTNKQKEFGDLHARAIDEMWYKAAVLQHQIDKDSFVYTVPFNAGLNDTLVTGSYAIFPSDAGVEAPGSVVGFQFSQHKLKERVQNITSDLSKRCSDCEKCGENLHCYVVDHSGYIVVSLIKDNNHTGKFFGEIEGDILESMLKENIFEEVILYDLQALCKIDNGKNNSATNLITPYSLIKNTMNWFTIKLVWYISLINLWTTNYAEAQNEIDYIVPNSELDEVLESENGESMSSNETESSADDKKDDDEEDEDSKDKGPTYYACEKEIRLYILQQEKFKESDSHYSYGDFENDEKDIRSYYIKRIRNSNLVFIAINAKVLKTNDIIFTTNPQIMENDTMLPCQKKDLNNLPRRRLVGCFNEHYLEHEIKTCGKSNILQENINLILTLIIILICVLNK